MDAEMLLAALRDLYPAEREAKGAIALEIEPDRGENERSE
jgi:hypothetical protein